jgi:hypothetical protein
MQVTGSSNTQATNSPRVRTKHARSAGGEPARGMQSEAAATVAGNDGEPDRANVALRLCWAPTHLHNHNVLKT